MAQLHGVHIETIRNPLGYSYAQIEFACKVASMLNRGKLVLVEEPSERGESVDDR